MPMWLQKIIAQVVLLAVGFVPVWIILFVIEMAQPEGFWQTMAILGAWAFLLGGVQLVLCIVMIVFSFAVWDSERIF